MLCRISLTLLELWEVFDDTLHIFNRVKLCGTFLRREEFVHEALDFPRKITEIIMHDTSVKVIILTRDHNFLHLL